MGDFGYGRMALNIGGGFCEWVQVFRIVGWFWGWVNGL